MWQDSLTVEQETVSKEQGVVLMAWILIAYLLVVIGALIVDTTIRMNKAKSKKTLEK